VCHWLRQCYGSRQIQQQTALAEPVAPFFNGLLRRPARPSFSTCLTDPRRATMRPCLALLYYVTSCRRHRRVHRIGISCLKPMACCERGRSMSFRHTARRPTRSCFPTTERITCASKGLSPTIAGAFGDGMRAAMNGLPTLKMNVAFASKVAICALQ